MREIDERKKREERLRKGMEKRGRGKREGEERGCEA